MRSQQSPYFVGPPDRRPPWKKAMGRRARWLRKFVLFVVACIATYGLEHTVIHYLAHSEGAATTLSQSLFGGRELYRSAVAAWPRRLVPRYTALVYIDPWRTRRRMAWPATSASSATTWRNCCPRSSSGSRP